MARLKFNGVAATLSGAHSSGTTTLTVAVALSHSGGVAVPTIAAPDYLPVSILDSNGVLSEIVHITAYTSGATTATITRGQEGTAGVAHSNGDKAVVAAMVSDLDGPHPFLMGA